MMRVRLNNQEITLDDAQTIKELLNNHGYTDGCYAVTLNRNFVAKHTYDHIKLNDRDHVEIIHPMQGG
ncbi:MAG: thiamine biosynthesis protein ThiS [Gammaproteobacteria bacterium RIFCSPHIGHO2_12_FULL_42_10]|nr:MAG: thiamine biosynthesis protein ThiS [Gammaproteobacteria bacterium RIFCSPHIGHO2_12_FULL_42_10]